MLHSSMPGSSPWPTPRKAFWRALVQGTLLTLTLAVNALPPAWAAEPAATPPRQFSMRDGVYLYGQSPQPEQIGQAYLVFEVKQGAVVGAFYMPRSSFDCFQGTVQANRLAVTIVNSYDQTASPYSIALVTHGAAIASATQNPQDIPVGLEGYYAIADVSSNDQRILGVCKADTPTTSQE